MLLRSAMCILALGLGITSANAKCKTSGLEGEWSGRVTVYGDIITQDGETFQDRTDLWCESIKIDKNGNINTSECRDYDNYYYYKEIIRMNGDLSINSKCKVSGHFSAGTGKYKIDTSIDGYSDSNMNMLRAIPKRDYKTKGIVSAKTANMDLVRR